MHCTCFRTVKKTRLASASVGCPLGLKVSVARGEENQRRPISLFFGGTGAQKRGANPGRSTKTVFGSAPAWPKLPNKWCVKKLGLGLGLGFRVCGVKEMVLPPPPSSLVVFQKECGGAGAAGGELRLRRGALLLRSGAVVWAGRGLQLRGLHQQSEQPLAETGVAVTCGARFFLFLFVFPPTERISVFGFV